MKAELKFCGILSVNVIGKIENDVLNVFYCKVTSRKNRYYKFGEYIEISYRDIFDTVKIRKYSNLFSGKIWAEKEHPIIKKYIENGKICYYNGLNKISKF